MIQAEHIGYHYRRGPAVLEDVSFDVPDGSFLAILGNNGVGKSTLLKCFNRILRPDTGSIYMDGESLLHLSQRALAQKVAFVAQTVPSTELTVHDMVTLGRRPYMHWGFSSDDHRIVHEAMERLELSHLRGRYLSQLSGGERQKVMLARALAQEPKLLLLDEPTSSLDIQNQYQVLEIVRGICRDTGITAMVVIHDINLALRFCDRFLLLRQGRVFASGDRSIIDRKALQEVYGVRAQVIQVQGQEMLLMDEDMGGNRYE